MYECTTVKRDAPCIFMKKTGCSFPCTPIVAHCFTNKHNRCEHIREVFNDQDSDVTEYCNVYPQPFTKWYTKCPMATHNVKEEVKEKKILDPRKAAKLRRKGM